MIRLVALRAAALLALTAPGFALTLLGLGRGAGHLPYFTEGPYPLPIAHLVRLALGHAPTAGLALLGLGALAFVHVDQPLTAMALDAHGESAGPIAIRLARARRHTAAFLRVLCLVLLGWAGAAFLVARVIAAIDQHGQRAGWSGLQLVVVLPALRVIATAALFAACAAFGLVARALIVEGDRRLVRRTAWLALRVVARRPLHVLAYVILTLGVQAGSGAAMLGLRPALTPADAALRAIAWAGGALLQCVAWYALARAAQRLVAGPAFAPLRAVPDAPWGVIAAVRTRLRR